MVQLTPQKADGNGARSSKRWARHANLHGWAFSLPYVVLLLLFGVFPGVYAVLLMFADFDRGRPLWFEAGLENFRIAFSDFRLAEATLNVVKFLGISIPVGIGLVTLIALLLHMRRSRGAVMLRTLFFVPGALAGVPAVLLAAVMFDPNLSPFAPLLELLGNESVVNTLQQGNLPSIFTVITFFAGAGAWIAIFYGGLNSIPEELIEAAISDGASPWQLAWHLKRPLIKPYIVYMLVIVFATNIQLFAEPEVLAGAAVAPIAATWSINQLAYTFAFQLGLFGVAAVISLAMLLVGLAAAGIVLKYTEMF